jgi:hypothetical protein
MKNEQIDERIKLLKQDIKELEKAKKSNKKNKSQLLEEISEVIETHLRADDPVNISTRTILFTPIMEEIKTILKKRKL